jgi:hypothetical protein
MRFFFDHPLLRTKRRPDAAVPVRKIPFEQQSRRLLIVVAHMNVVAQTTGDGEGIRVAFRLGEVSDPVAS